MIKLFKIVSEIKVMGNLGGFINLNLIPPELNENFLQWMSKNDMKEKYIDSIKGGYSIKPETQPNFFSSNIKNLLSNYNSNLEIVQFFNDKLLELLRIKLQSFFNQYWGENRIIVKILPFREDRIKFFPENDKEFFINDILLKSNNVRFYTKERPKLLMPKND